MEVATFVEIEPEFLARVSQMVWCNVATVDGQGRPRSRILHPIWEGPIGWIATNPQSHKARHFTQNPYVSLAYIADVAKPVYADCRVEWVDDPAEKARVWELIRTTPEPLGYDPAPIFEAPDSPKFGLLRLTPWRIEIYSFPAPNLIWRQ
jgi:general stress protein 26